MAATVATRIERLERRSGGGGEEWVVFVLRLPDDPDHGDGRAFTLRLGERQLGDEDDEDAENWE